ncbi:synaptotagmin-16-like isoform X4 [Asterias amurensis]|uniref:synaptotagmin-16-like isoform X4 n=1 Tax=Asterias amurensis TaxID=7602 RepID=UPI003AB55509
MGKAGSLCCCCKSPTKDDDDVFSVSSGSTLKETTPLLSSALTSVSELPKSETHSQNSDTSGKPELLLLANAPDLVQTNSNDKSYNNGRDELRKDNIYNQTKDNGSWGSRTRNIDDGNSDVSYTFKRVGNTQKATGTTGVRGDDVSLAEQGMTRGSTGSLEYHDDPEEIREERGDEAYLVTAEEPEPVPEDVLNYQESAPTIGQLEVIFDYNGDGNRMNVTIIKGLGLPTKENGGASAWRLRIMLYPKKQRTKTRIRESEEPIFKELFRFTRIRPHELVNSAIRFRLYGAERMRKERLIGEGLVKFSSLNTSSKESVIVNLVSRSEAVGGGTASPYSSNSDLSASGESNASLQSLAHGGLPELLVGLTYNATTGRLAVELIKGSHFKQHAAGRAPDSYVRIALMSSSGFEMTKSKTSVRRGQPNPTFKETFIFQVAQFQLADVTLMFSVFNKRGMKRKETIGWFTMGLSNSSDEETAHWKEMRESKGHQVCRWHAMSDK